MKELNEFLLWCFDNRVSMIIKGDLDVRTITLRCVEGITYEVIRNISMEEARVVNVETLITRTVMKLVEELCDHTGLEYP